MAGCTFISRTNAAWQAALQLPELAPVAAVVGNADDGDANASDALGEIIQRNTIEHWARTLRPCGVSFTANLTMEDYRNDPVVRNAGFIVTREHEVWGSVDHSGTTARLSETPPRLGIPTPWFGLHTDEILAEAGSSATEIQALKNAGAVRVPTP